MDLDLNSICNLQRARAVTRRQFLKHSQTGLGAIALAMLMGREGRAADRRPRAGRTLTAAADNPMAPRPPHFPAKAKRVIYLHMSGAPPQQDLFDYKPKLVKHNMQPCPDELLKNQRFAFIKGHPKLLGTPVQVPPARRERPVDQRPACPTSARSSTTSRSSGRCTPTSSTTPRPSCSSSPARRATAAPRWARGSPTGWAPRTRTCPASSS